MEMTLRWYGSAYDTVTLKQIRQIPGVTGVITTLYGKAAGEEWTREEIRALKAEVEEAGLHIAGIESVNVHDAIKAGTAEREQYIKTYIRSLKALGEEDIHLVCYNFMPVFDWTRTELARVRPDGSTVLAYTQEAVDGLDPEKMFTSISSDMNGSVMPGWEPERMEHVKELFDLYREIDEEKLFENLKYFLEAIMPVCRKYDIKMAIHPDDPAWSVFGLPRIIINEKNILRMMRMVDDVHNGVTFCSGSYGTNLENDLPHMIRALKGRIHFAHVRNLKFHTPENFEEAAHLSSDGSLDMYEIMRALYETGFEGPIRPDHGRMIWDEVAMPGYGLYDRALGATYLNGLWEAIKKADQARRLQTDRFPAGTFSKEATLWREIQKRTLAEPEWIHFGAGNLFRAFPARVLQEAIEQGTQTKGVLAVEGFDGELVEKVYRPYENRFVAVTLCADGTMKEQLCGSIAACYNIADPSEKRSSDWAALSAQMKKNSVRALSFTITEKGYVWKGADGKPLPAVERDFQRGPNSMTEQCPLESYLGKVAALLYGRYQAGGNPIALVSMDNCSENGKRLQEAIEAYAAAWAANGTAEEGFIGWLQDKNKVGFPWTMIDKITPRPAEEVLTCLTQKGFVGMEPVITAAGSYSAPYVNAEECEYLVMEDWFPAGRIPLSGEGIYFADRETVKKAERMKVSTCLNPLHTALAVFGCLLGYERIAEEMKDRELKELVERIGWTEGMAVVTDPKILRPETFLEEVLKKRLPNGFLPDSPWRIATDTSQKLGVRFGETVKAYQKQERSLEDLKAIPLVYAGWVRYLTGIDDTGTEYTVSPDPRLAELEPVISPLRERLAFRIGQQGEEFTREEEQQLADSMKPLFSREDIFGYDVTETPLFRQVIKSLARMLSGVGAVRQELGNYLHL